MELIYATGLTAFWLLIIMPFASTNRKLFRIFNRKPFNCGLCMGAWLSLIMLLLVQQTHWTLWPVTMVAGGALGMLVDMVINKINE